MFHAVGAKLMVTGLSVLLTLAALAYVGSLNVPALQSPACQSALPMVGSPR